MEAPERVQDTPEDATTGQVLEAIRHARVPTDDELSQVMDLSEARRELGLDRRVIYLAVKRKQVHAFKVGGKGRTYYPEWELRELAGRVAIRELYRGHLAA